MSLDDEPRLQGDRALARGTQILRKFDVCAPEQRQGSHSPPAQHPETQSFGSPLHSPLTGLRSGPGHHREARRLLERGPLISLLSLPTRVPISANNNIHINRFLDHSHQNTRDS